MPWPSKGQPPGIYNVKLAYHWLDKEGNLVVHDGLMTPLPYDIKPKEEIILNSKVKTPDRQGDYILEFDMLQEGVSWFKSKGSKTTKINVIVK